MTVITCLRMSYTAKEHSGNITLGRNECEPAFIPPESAHLTEFLSTITKAISCRYFEILPIILGHGNWLELPVRGNASGRFELSYLGKVKGD